MKVLYISSNHANNSTLMVEHEITELQRDAIYGVGRRMEFVFLPALPFEDVENQILVHKPDIVHISAHGEKDSLELMDSKGNPRKLTDEALRVLLAPSPPKLVYLNACDSADLAKAITDTVSFTIGTEAPITNFAARKGAVSFYRALAQGRTLLSAFKSSKSTVETLGNIETSLFPQNNEVASSPVFYEPIRLVAHFHNHKTDFPNGSANFDIGIAGCPASTIQTVFTTNDRTFLSGDDETLEEDLCSVSLDMPWNGEIWLDYAWNTWGDIKIFALLITASGEHFSVSSTLCDALTAFYQVYHQCEPVEFPTDLKQAIAKLKANDGSRMRASDEKSAVVRRKKSTKKLTAKQGS